MSSHVTCPGCGTRLAYQGSLGGKVKPCPKCQTPIAFVMASPSAPAPPEEVLAEVIAPPAKPAVAPTNAAPPSAGPAKSSSPWWVLIPLGIAGGGVLLLLVMCGGIGLLVMGLSDSEASVAPAASLPAASAPSEAAYIPAALPVYSEPVYAPATTYVEPAPAYVPPANPGYASDSDLYNFFGIDRISELEAAIAADREKLLQLDVAIAAAAGGQGAGRVVERESETAADQIAGVIVGAIAEGAKSQLQTERAAVQARLNANVAELVTLQR